LANGPTTVEEENQVAKAQQMQRIRERARTFQEIFGAPGAPTRHGKIMLEALQAKFGHALPPNVLDNTGRTDPYQTWRRLGHFDVLEYLNTQLAWKESDHVNTSSGGT
jgi:hypothetical protein